MNTVMEGVEIRCSRGLPRLATWLLIALSLLYASSSFATTRVAMVVGNSAYAAHARLANPGNDAKALADVFRSIGFDEVVLATDVTRLEFESALDTFHDLAKTADVAVFFYAGHAIQWQGGNYMIPVDAQLESERDIKRLILLDDVVKDASSSRELGLVILDACRDNPFQVQLAEQGTRGLQRVGLASPPGAAGTMVAYATQADAVAFDGTGNHSPYTKALIKHLPTANQDISLVFRAVRDEVAAETDWQQQPFTYGSLGGDEIWLVTDDSIQPGATTQAPVARTQAVLPPDGMAFFSVDAIPSDAR
ncbi:caspase family protein, partial [bacterium]|nr:caspase family protein [bacterium]